VSRALGRHERMFPRSRQLPLRAISLIRGIGRPERTSFMPLRRPLICGEPGASGDGARHCGSLSAVSPGNTNSLRQRQCFSTLETALPRVLPGCSQLRSVSNRQSRRAKLCRRCSKPLPAPKVEDKDRRWWLVKFRDDELVAITFAIFGVVVGEERFAAARVRYRSAQRS
jgi:hypothetical protein